MFDAGLAQPGHRSCTAPSFGTLTFGLGGISAERTHNLARTCCDFMS